MTTGRLVFAAFDGTAASAADAQGDMAAALDGLLAAVGPAAVSRVVRVVAPGPAAGLTAVASFRSDLPTAELAAMFRRVEAGIGDARSGLAGPMSKRPLGITLLLAVPAALGDVPAEALPDGRHHRAAVVELIRLRALSCPVPAMPAGTGDPAVPVGFGSGQIGHAACWLHRDRMGRPVASGAGRAALVTGGAVRLGREIVRTLARAGYDIALHYHSSAAEAERAAAECRSLGVRCEAFRADLSDAACLPALMDDVVDRFPHLQLLVNSASVYQGGRIADTTVEVLDRQWAINFRSPFLLMKEFGQRIARGAAGRGAVINMIDSKVAFNQFHYAAYLTSKKALAEATKMAALEFAPAIRVNGLAPGVVLPPSTRDPAYLEWRRDGIPVGRLGHPAQLYEPLLMLAGNDFITGQIIMVDGGEGMSFTGRNAHDFKDAGGRPLVVDRAAA